MPLPPRGHARSFRDVTKACQDLSVVMRHAQNNNVGRVKLLTAKSFQKMRDILEVADSYSKFWKDRHQWKYEI